MAEDSQASQTSQHIESTSEVALAPGATHRDVSITIVVIDNTATF